MNPVLEWMQEHIAYWERERQMAERTLLETTESNELIVREQRMRKMLANRIIHQLETLAREVNRGDA